MNYLKKQKFFHVFLILVFLCAQILPFPGVSFADLTTDPNLPQQTSNPGVSANTTSNTTTNQNSTTTNNNSQIGGQNTTLTTPTPAPVSPNGSYSIDQQSDGTITVTNISVNPPKNVGTYHTNGGGVSVSNQAVYFASSSSTSTKVDLKAVKFSNGVEIAITMNPPASSFQFKDGAPGVVDVVQNGQHKLYDLDVTPGAIVPITKEAVLGNTYVTIQGDDQVMVRKLSDGTKFLGANDASYDVTNIQITDKVVLVSAVTENDPTSSIFQSISLTTKTAATIIPKLSTGAALDALGNFTRFNADGSVSFLRGSDFIFYKYQLTFNTANNQVASLALVGSPEQDLKIQSISDSYMALLRRKPDVAALRDFYFGNANVDTAIQAGNEYALLTNLGSFLQGAGKPVVGIDEVVNSFYPKSPVLANDQTAWLAQLKAANATYGGWLDSLNKGTVTPANLPDAIIKSILIDAKYFTPYSDALKAFKTNTAGIVSKLYADFARRSPSASEATSWVRLFDGLRYLNLSDSTKDMTFDLILPLFNAFKNGNLPMSVQVSQDRKYVLAQMSTTNFKLLPVTDTATTIVFSATQPQLTTSNPVASVTVANNKLYYAEPAVGGTFNLKSAAFSTFTTAPVTLYSNLKSVTFPAGLPGVADIVLSDGVSKRVYLPSNLEVAQNQGLISPDQRYAVVQLPSQLIVIDRQDNTISMVDPGYDFTNVLVTNDYVLIAGPLANATADNLKSASFQYVPLNVTTKTLTGITLPALPAGYTNRIGSLTQFSADGSQVTFAITNGKDKFSDLTYNLKFDAVKHTLSFVISPVPVPAINQRMTDINNIYTNLLGRPVDAQNLIQWVKGNPTDDQIRAAIMGGAEYEVRQAVSQIFGTALLSKLYPANPVMANNEDKWWTQLSDVYEKVIRDVNNGSLPVDKILFNPDYSIPGTAATFAKAGIFQRMIENSGGLNYAATYLDAYNDKLQAIITAGGSNAAVINQIAADFGLSITSSDRAKWAGFLQGVRFSGQGPSSVFDRTGNMIDIAELIAMTEGVPPADVQITPDSGKVVVLMNGGSQILVYSIASDNTTGNPNNRFTVTPQKIQLPLPVQEMNVTNKKIYFTYGADPSINPLYSITYGSSAPSTVDLPSYGETVFTFVGFEPGRRGIINALSHNPNYAPGSDKVRLFDLTETNPLNAFVWGFPTYSPSTFFLHSNDPFVSPSGDYIVSESGMGGINVTDRNSNSDITVSYPTSKLIYGLGVMDAGFIDLIQSTTSAGVQTVNFEFRKFNAPAHPDQAMTVGAAVPLTLPPDVNIANGVTVAFTPGQDGNSIVAHIPFTYNGNGGEYVVTFTYNPQTNKVTSVFNQIIPPPLSSIPLKSYLNALSGSGLDTVAGLNQYFSITNVMYQYLNYYASIGGNDGQAELKLYNLLKNVHTFSPLAVGDELLSEAKNLLLMSPSTDILAAIELGKLNVLIANVPPDPLRVAINSTTPVNLLSNAELQAAIDLVTAAIYPPNGTVNLSMQLAVRQSWLSVEQAQRITKLAQIPSRQGTGTQSPAYLYVVETTEKLLRDLAATQTQLANGATLGASMKTSLTTAVTAMTAELNYRRGMPAGTPITVNPYAANGSITAATGSTSTATATATTAAVNAALANIPLISPLLQSLAYGALNGTPTQVGNLITALGNNPATDQAVAGELVLVSKGFTSWQQIYGANPPQYVKDSLQRLLGTTQYPPPAVTVAQALAIDADAQANLIVFAALNGARQNNSTLTSSNLINAAVALVQQQYSGNARAIQKLNALNSSAPQNATISTLPLISPLLQPLANGALFGTSTQVGNVINSLGNAPATDEFIAGEILLVAKGYNTWQQMWGSSAPQYVLDSLQRLVGSSQFPPAALTLAQAQAIDTDAMANFILFYSLAEARQTNSSLTGNNLINAAVTLIQQKYGNNLLAIQKLNALSNSATQVTNLPLIGAALQPLANGALFGTSAQAGNAISLLGNNPATDNAIAGQLLLVAKGYTTWQQIWGTNPPQYVKDSLLRLVGSAQFPPAAISIAQAQAIEADAEANLIVAFSLGQARQNNSNLTGSNLINAATALVQQQYGNNTLALQKLNALNTPAAPISPLPLISPLLQPLANGALFGTSTQVGNAINSLGNAPATDEFIAGEILLVAKGYNTWQQMWGASAPQYVLDSLKRLVGSAQFPPAALTLAQAQGINADAEANFLLFYALAEARQNNSTLTGNNLINAAAVLIQQKYGNNMLALQKLNALSNTTQATNLPLISPVLLPLANGALNKTAAQVGTALNAVGNNPAIDQAIAGQLVLVSKGYTTWQQIWGSNPPQYVKDSLLRLVGSAQFPPAAMTVAQAQAIDTNAEANLIVFAALNGAYKNSNSILTGSNLKSAAAALIQQLYGNNALALQKLNAL